ncbi:thiopurine S-methyltransferase [Marinicella sediminis]|uniref:Thiopurine S-methyltransferase n=1 Tax=Marinicella sediminis TaxID=1792834 RepID=A0ABV7JAV1_9GAMM|nr:thiopurine S-methyltransferase [Marinicella sediminis]
MEHQFWHEKWNNNEIGFHQSDTNPWLIKYLNKLNLTPNGRLFLPLCGKTRDIDWLLQQGYQVIGSELNESAVQQLFDRLKVTPDVQNSGLLKIYMSGPLKVFTGDLFALQVNDLGHVDATFDRAALVALPTEMRQQYAVHITSLTAMAPQLLICFAYNQFDMDGPPFSVTEAEIRSLYANHYTIHHLDEGPVKGGLKGHCPAMETCWLLSKESEPIA